MNKRNPNRDIGKKNAHQPQFYKRVFEVVSMIPPGKISTYSDVAKACGCPRGSRAVGNALRCNQDTSKVPCHRVVKHDSTLGGYAGGMQKKKKMLQNEGISFQGDRIENFSKLLFNFNTD